MEIHEPAMTFISEKAAEEWAEGLAKNKDDYGRACYKFASEWAILMETAIEAGQTVEECKDKTGHDADGVEGITGFMYGCAVNMLAQWWIHGEKLRRKHNLDTQIGNEGEKANEKGSVLNPALITITTKDKE